VPGSKIEIPADLIMSSTHDEEAAAASPDKNGPRPAPGRETCKRQKNVSLDEVELARAAS
jgi:hypothetical protein